MHQPGIVLCLIYSEDDAGIHDQQKQVGDCAVAFLTNQLDAVAHKSKQHDKKHFHKL